jgi:hypothetical protein
VVVANWTSRPALRAAVTDPAFGARMAAYPDGTTAAPHVFTRVEGPGICPGPGDGAAHVPTWSPPAGGAGRGP